MKLYIIDFAVKSYFHWSKPARNKSSVKQVFLLIQSEAFSLIHFKRIGDCELGESRVSMAKGDQ